MSSCICVGVLCLEQMKMSRITDRVYVFQAYFRVNVVTLARNGRIQFCAVPIGFFFLCAGKSQQSL